MKRACRLRLISSTFFIASTIAKELIIQSLVHVQVFHIRIWWQIRTITCFAPQLPLVFEWHISSLFELQRVVLLRYTPAHMIRLAGQNDLRVCIRHLTLGPESNSPPSIPCPLIFWTLWSIWSFLDCASSWSFCGILIYKTWKPGEEWKISGCEIVKRLFSSWQPLHRR